MRVLITGANRGLGLEFTKIYLSRGDEVIATCRNPMDANNLALLHDKYSDKLTVLELDVTNQIQRNRIYDEIKKKFDFIDLLINNAGIVSGSGGSLLDARKVSRLGKLHDEDMCKVFQTNAIAPTILAEQYMNLLKKGTKPKIINIGAKMGSFESKDYGGYYSYSASKVALNMFTKNLALDMKRRGIIVASIYPHWNKTAMGGEKAEYKPYETISKIVNLIDELEEQDSGQFIDGLSGEYLGW